MRAACRTAALGPVRFCDCVILCIVAYMRIGARTPCPPLHWHLHSALGFVCESRSGKIMRYTHQAGSAGILPASTTVLVWRVGMCMRIGYNWKLYPCFLNPKPS
jgi:hypothetical protein